MSEQVVVKAIKEMIVRFKNNSEMLTSTEKFLDELLAICTEESLHPEVDFGPDVGREVIDDIEIVVELDQKIVISCDASITKNPGGDAAIGFVIEHPNSETLKMSKPTRAKTINEAEYDAVYEALTTLFNLRNNTSLLPLEVRSDSKLIIKQLNGEWKCSEERLERRRQAILELVSQLPAAIQFVWMPRNSTPALKLANDIAQNYLGVKNH